MVVCVSCPAYIPLSAAVVRWKRPPLGQQRRRNSGTSRAIICRTREALLSHPVAAAMSSRRCKTDTDLLKLQGGTGKHIDGDVNRPLASRPFQALVQLTDAAPSGSDGSLHVLPGFHVAASRFFHAAGATAPEGGFTPLSEYEDICHPDLWVAVRRMPPQWAKVHEKLPACGAAQARGREGMSRALRKLAAELRDERTMGRAEPVHTRASRVRVHKCSACAGDRECMPCTYQPCSYHSTRCRSA